MSKTEIKKFCRRALIIEAAQFDGTVKSLDIISEWHGADSKPAIKYITPGCDKLHAYDVTIFTPNGGIAVNSGDWIVRETDGNFYPVKRETFSKSYGALQNKLIGDNYRKEISKIYYGFCETRRSGRSYGQALEVIGSAMQKPETPFRINDHFGTQSANKHLAKMIIEIIEKLQLKHFEIEHVEPLGLCLIYKIFEAEKKEK
jgi:hypothetical protein